jgi:hypothetical protein
MGMFRNNKQIDRKIATGRRLEKRSRKKEVVHGWSCLFLRGFCSNERRSGSCGAKLDQDQPRSFFLQPSPDSKHDLPLSSITITACDLCHTVDAARGILRFLVQVQGQPDRLRPVRLTSLHRASNMPWRYSEPLCSHDQRITTHEN